MTVRSRWIVLVFFFQAEDGIRDLVRSRGLGDVYKRQALHLPADRQHPAVGTGLDVVGGHDGGRAAHRPGGCLLYTSDAADERSSVDLGGRRIIKKKKQQTLAKTSSVARTLRLHTAYTEADQ